MDVLVLSRKPGERILIGDQIAITIVKVSQGGVRVGIEAPDEVAVVREELAQQIEQAEREAAQLSDGEDIISIKIPFDDIPTATS